MKCYIPHRLLTPLVVAASLIAGCKPAAAPQKPPSLESKDPQERLRAIDAAATKFGGAPSQQPGDKP